jgi:hypothetical protein
MPPLVVIMSSAVLIKGYSRPSKELVKLSRSNTSELFMQQPLPRDVSLFLFDVLSTGLVFPEPSLDYSLFR